MIITDIDKAAEIMSNNLNYSVDRECPSHFERLVIFNDIMKKYKPDHKLDLYTRYDEESISFGEFPEEGMEEEDLIALGKAFINLSPSEDSFYIWA